MADTQPLMRERSLPLTARIALVAALAWCLVLLVGGFTFPVYGTSSSSASIDASGSATSTEVTSTATLVQVNGVTAAVVLGIPLVATLLVWALLHWRSRAAAWVVTAVLGVLTILALMSVGLFVLPVTIALVVACSSASSPAARTVGG